MPEKTEKPETASTLPKNTAIRQVEAIEAAVAVLTRIAIALETLERKTPNADGTA